MRRAAIPVVALVALVGCSAIQLPATQTPLQGFYKAQGVYNIVASAALAYVKTPTARPELVVAIRAVDARAYSAILHGNTLVQSAASADRDRELDLVASMLEAAADELRSYLKTAGIGEAGGASL